MSLPEPLCKSNENDFIYSSTMDTCSEFYEMFQTQLSCLWTAQEIDMAQDKQIFANELNKDEQHFFSMILAFFASADAIVSLNIEINFIHDFPSQIIRSTYATQNMFEYIHGDTYSRLIEATIPDRKEQQKLFNAVTEIESINKKYKFMQKWITCGCPLQYRLMGYVLTEGLFFSGSFCAIYWNKNKGGKKALPGLCSANEFIARDEGMHCKFGVALYNRLKNRLSIKQAHEMFKQSVEIEREFINEALPCRLIGMNADLMTQYIQYVADFWLSEMKYPKIFFVDQPFPFMDSISIESKSNFFEHRPSQYARAEVTTKFGFDDDF